MISEYIIKYERTHNVFLFDVFTCQDEAILIVYDYEDDRTEFIRTSADGDLVNGIKALGGKSCFNKDIEIVTTSEGYKVSIASHQHNNTINVKYNREIVQDFIKEYLLWFPKETGTKDYFGPMSHMYNVDVTTKVGKNNFNDKIENRWGRETRTAYFKFLEHINKINPPENRYEEIDPNDTYQYISEPLVLGNTTWYPPRTNAARALQKSKNINNQTESQQSIVDLTPPTKDEIFYVDSINYKRIAGTDKPNNLIPELSDERLIKTFQVRFIRIGKSIYNTPELYKQALKINPEASVDEIHDLIIELNEGKASYAV